MKPLLPTPDHVVRGAVHWPYVITFVTLHLSLLLVCVPWLFSWTAVITMLVGVHVFGQSITLCYHRMLTHRSVRVPLWLERVFVLLALCCLQDTPAKWVATHRYHHQHSDQEQDPHTPRVTFLWSHIGWLMQRSAADYNFELFHKYAPDLLKDRFYMNLEKSMRWAWIYVAHALLFFAAGFGVGVARGGDALEGLRMGLSMLVWAALARTVIVWHITWSVNSLSHLFGYASYDTGDESRNNWLVALLSVGEGWHNNHHHDPASASNHHRWWEFDLTYYEICLLERLGLATAVVPPRHRRQAKRQQGAPQADPGEIIP